MTDLDGLEGFLKILNSISVTGILSFFLWYFMKREDKREQFIASVIKRNTAAIFQLAKILEKNEPKNDNFNSIGSSILDNPDDI